MVPAHARTLDALPPYRASAAEVPGGVQLTVTARDTTDARLVRKLRALGFAGVMTLDDHHAMHHLMLARGMAGHEH